MVGGAPDEQSTILEGRYRLERVLGEGAFGRVYVAFDTRLQRTVAVKELSATRTSADPQIFERYLDRFGREARAAGSVFHPHIVNVFELAIDRHNNHYLVMEYVDGGNLLDLLQQVQTLPVERALQITLEIARALEAIHEIDIVHRDLKPANIMLTRRGEAKLADFGIAQLSNESHRTQLTVGHPGTPLYMSPEQRQNTDYLDGRSDLYSLGLVLYEMLAGEPYPRRKKALESLRPDLPDAVVALVRRLTERDPDRRYQSADALIADLQAIVATQSGENRPFVAPSVGGGIAAVPTEIPAHEIAIAQAETVIPAWELGAVDVAERAGTGTQRFDGRPLAGGETRGAPTGRRGMLGALGALIVLLALVGGWFITQGGKQTVTPSTPPPTLASGQSGAPPLVTVTPLVASVAVATNTAVPPTVTPTPPATQTPPTSTPTTAPTPRPSATTRPDFQTITDQRNGFSFAYPKAWQRSDDQTDQETLYSIRISPSAQFLVGRENNPKFTTLDGYIEDEIQGVTSQHPGWKVGPRARQVTMLGGQEARIADFLAPSDAGQTYRYFVITMRPNQAWALLFILPLNDFNTYQHDIDDVVRSFAFCPANTCPPHASAALTTSSAESPYRPFNMAMEAILRRQVSG